MYTLEAEKMLITIKDNVLRRQQYTKGEQKRAINKYISFVSSNDENDDDEKTDKLDE